MIYFQAHALNNSSACVNFMMYRLLVLTFAFCFERIRLFLSSAYVNFMMYRLLVLTFAFCFERLRLFLLTKLCVYHAYTSILTRMRCVIQAHASILWCIGLLCWRLCFVSNVYVCFEPTQKYVFWQKCVSNQRIHFNFHTWVFFLLHIHHFCGVCACLADVCVVFLTCTCVMPQHTRIFSDRGVF